MTRDITVKKSGECPSDLRYQPAVFEVSRPDLNPLTPMSYLKNDFTQVIHVADTYHNRRKYLDTQAPT